MKFGDLSFIKASSHSRTKTLNNNFLLKFNIVFSVCVLKLKASTTEENPFALRFNVKRFHDVFKYCKSVLYERLVCPI